MAEASNIPARAEPPGGRPAGYAGRFPTLSALLRWRPRFSLRTLLAAVCLAGSGLGVWLHWDPWRPLWVVETPESYARLRGFSRDGRRLMTMHNHSEDVTEPSALRIWDVPTGAVIGAFHPEPKGYSCVTGPWTGQRYVVYELSKWDVGDRVIRHVGIWDTESGEARELGVRRVSWIPNGHGYRVVSVSGQGRFMLLDDADHLRIIETSSGREMVAFPNIRYIERTGWSPDETWIVLLERPEPVSRPGAETVLPYDRLHLWDTVGGRKLATIETDLNAGHPGLFVLDGVRLAVSSDWGREWRSLGLFRIYDAQTGRKVAEGDEQVLSVNVTAEGSRFVVLDETGCYWVFDLGRRERIARLDRPKYAYTICPIAAEFSPNGRRVIQNGHVLNASGDAYPWVFDAQTGRAILEFPMGHLVVGPDGRRVGKMPTPNRLSLYDIEQGAELCQLRLPGPVEEWGGVEFAPGEEHLAMILGERTVGVWKRFRPEAWWGIVAMPAFWLCVLSAPLLVWSLCCDRRVLPSRR